MALGAAVCGLATLEPREKPLLVTHKSQVVTNPRISA